MSELIPVIVSGGSGARLWPKSRMHYPKPFIPLPDGSTLIEKTYRLATSIPGVNQICTVTNEEHFFLATDRFEHSGISGIRHQFLLEPVGRNTMPAIAAAAVQIEKQVGGDSILLVLPADHVIEQPETLIAAIQRAAEEARKDRIVTFSIKPTRPETEYGYIEMQGDRFLQFVEKPDLASAEAYAKSGRHFWNSGIFCFSVRTILEAMQTHCPEILDKVANCIEHSSRMDTPTSTAIRLDAKRFAEVPQASIDYAIMEKASNISCIPTDCGWSDVGSWPSFANFFPQDEHGNQITGDVIPVQSSNCIIDSDTRLVGLVGVDDLIVIDTLDALLVANRSKTNEVKELFHQLCEQGREAAVFHRTVHRPWGTYTVLEEGPRHKIKRIVVKPEAKLSMQLHHHRSEHWVVVSGTAQVTNEGEKFMLLTNQSTYIPSGNKHRLENPGIVPLVIIEVQSGDYLGEDDIIRFDDNYGRD